jgi:hypothetical protein
MVLVVVDIIDMDDLAVIRLAVADIIPRERIARAGMDVKGKFRGERRAGYLTLLQVFP